MSLLGELFGLGREKRVTKTEMERIQQRLYGELDEYERHDIEMLFRADLDENGVQQGISREEFERAVAWLREHPEKHSLEEGDIETVERYFSEHLRD